MWEAIRFVAHQYEVSPPKQYLQNLKWNGDKNAIRKLLPRHLGANDTERNNWIMEHMILENLYLHRGIKRKNFS
ncbi:hypothetical protein HMPREF3033_01448 [Veillonellaceae bacterium DNF00751]|nr:hypothetical protein HMPREF3033_01448 [Veillonellaceae bacterium DNF00751]